MLKSTQMAICIAFIIFFLGGCGSEPKEANAENASSIIEEKTPETNHVYGRSDDGDAMRNGDENENGGKNEPLSKDELPDGIYLIKEDSAKSQKKFEKMESDHIDPLKWGNCMAELETQEWPCLHPGDQIAFKGNFNITEDITLECSLHDFYTFPYTISLGYLTICPAFDYQSILDAVDTITVNGTSTSCNLYSGDDGWYLNDLDWKIEAITCMSNGGYFLDGNFSKGFQATMGGFHGTDYEEIDMAATCHVMEMPDGTFSSQPYRRKLNFEATKEGYFLLTIPSDIPTGYCHIHSYSSYSSSSDEISPYVHIQ